MIFEHLCALHAKNVPHMQQEKQEPPGLQSNEDNISAGTRRVEASTAGHTVFTRSFYANILRHGVTGAGWQLDFHCPKAVPEVDVAANQRVRLRREIKAAFRHGK